MKVTWGLLLKFLFGMYALNKEHMMIKAIFVYGKSVSGYLGEGSKYHDFKGTKYKVGVVSEALYRRFTDAPITLEELCSEMGK